MCFFNDEEYTKLNPSAILKFCKVFLTMINPIAPHWTEFIYREYLNPVFEESKLDQHKIKYLAFATFPKISHDIDSKLFAYNKYLKNVIQPVNELIAKKMSGGTGKEGQKEKGGKIEKEMTEEKTEKVDDNQIKESTEQTQNKDKDKTNKQKQKEKKEAPKEEKKEKPKKEKPVKKRKKWKEKKSKNRKKNSLFQ